MPNFCLDGGAELGAGFVALGRRDARAAARHVGRLAYGRNSRRADSRLVLIEGRGACSTKHALLAALAREHGRRVELRLGVYEMNASNTPGVDPVLLRYGVDRIPEAHCDLAYKGLTVDLTRTEVSNPIEDFLYEETIEPPGIGAYKVDVHRRFIRAWAADRGLDPERVWQIREECIGALSVTDVA